MISLQEVYDKYSEHYSIFFVSRGRYNKIYIFTIPNYADAILCGWMQSKKEKSEEDNATYIIMDIRQALDKIRIYNDKEIINAFLSGHILNEECREVYYRLISTISKINSNPDIVDFIFKTACVDLIIHIPMKKV